MKKLILFLFLLRLCYSQEVILDAKTEKNIYCLGEMITVEITIKNDSIHNYIIRHFSMHTPENGYDKKTKTPFNNILIINPEGKSLKFKGWFSDSFSPPPYQILAKGDKISDVLKVSDIYNFDIKGEYRILLQWGSSQEEFYPDKNIKEIAKKNKNAIFLNEVTNKKEIKLEIRSCK